MTESSKPTQKSEFEKLADRFNKELDLLTQIKDRLAIKVNHLSAKEFPQEVEKSNECKNSTSDVLGVMSDKIDALAYTNLKLRYLAEKLEVIV